LLQLDDPQWAQYKGNYTSGANVAKLISDLRIGSPTGDRYEEIFQELLHQYTLSEVAYASVPHLVEIAENNLYPRKEIMVLVGGCYAHSTDPGAPEIPPLLVESWMDAQTRSLPIILNVLEEQQLDGNDIRYLLSSLAAIKGQNEMSIAIEALET